MTKDKRPIDLQRESALSFELATETQNSEHTEVLELNAGLLIIRDSSIHEVKLADQIDPQRLNPHIPQTVQREVFRIGAKSELVARTILTARELLRQNFLKDTVDANKVYSIVYEAMTNFIAMHQTAKDMQDKSEQVESMFNDQVDRDNSLVMPSLGDCLSRAKTFAQKADHVLQAAQDLVKLFYPNISTKDFEKIYDAMKAQYGEVDISVQFLEQTLPFLKLTRDARNCLDHRNALGATVTDYELRPSGEIYPPMFSINFRDTKLAPVPLTVHMKKSLESMLDFFECLIAVLCSKKVGTFAGFPIQIVYIAEDQRKNAHIRYNWSIQMPDGLIPIG